MSAVIVLLALSALIGYCLGTSFSWIAIAISGVLLAVAASEVLQIQGFSALFGIEIVVTCLAVNQLSYLLGSTRRTKGLFQKQADKEPGQRRNNDVAGDSLEKINTAIETIEREIKS
jgi:hypothetical protein